MLTSTSLSFPALLTRQDVQNPHRFLPCRPANLQLDLSNDIRGTRVRDIYGDWVDIDNDNHVLNSAAGPDLPPPAPQTISTPLTSIPSRLLSSLLPGSSTPVSISAPLIPRAEAHDSSAHFSSRTPFHLSTRTPLSARCYTPEPLNISTPLGARCHTLEPLSTSTPLSSRCPTPEPLTISSRCHTPEPLNISTPLSARCHTPEPVNISTPLLAGASTPLELTTGNDSPSFSHLATPQACSTPETFPPVTPSTGVNTSLLNPPSSDNELSFVKPATDPNPGSIATRKCLKIPPLLFKPDFSSDAEHDPEHSLPDLDTSGTSVTFPHQNNHNAKDSSLSLASSDMDTSSTSFVFSGKGKHDDNNCFPLLSAPTSHHPLLSSTRQWVNIASANGLVPNGTQPLPEPMLTSVKSSAHPVLISTSPNLSSTSSSSSRSYHPEITWDLSSSSFTGWDPKDLPSGPRDIDPSLLYSSVQDIFAEDAWTNLKDDLNPPALSPLSVTLSSHSSYGSCPPDLSPQGTAPSSPGPKRLKLDIHNRWKNLDSTMDVGMGDTNVLDTTDFVKP